MGKGGERIRSCAGGEFLRSCGEKRMLGWTRRRVREGRGVNKREEEWEALRQSEIGWEVGESRERSEEKVGRSAGDYRENRRGGRQVYERGAGCRESKSWFMSVRVKGDSGLMMGRDEDQVNVEELRNVGTKGGLRPRFLWHSLYSSETKLVDIRLAVVPWVPSQFTKRPQCLKYSNGMSSIIEQMLYVKILQVVGFGKKMSKTSVMALIVAVSWLLVSNGHGRVEAQGGSADLSKPAAFIFGDSLVDPGNNRYIASISRADWSPYGVDFAPSGFRPTGRFTNGRTLSDIIGKLYISLMMELGQDTLPQPYLAPGTHGQVLLNGVNYASGAGGILDSSGAIFLARLSFDTQINYFENTKRELVSMLGEDMAMQFLSRSLFSIVFGSNDYLDNYLLPFSVTKAQYSPQDYEDLLISRFGEQLN
ncbi:hypothetical protein KI387_029367, partial [Taxus chinensis]